MLIAVLALLVTLPPCAPSARAIISEILYDAAGDDTGHEFVELYNPGPAPIALAGLRLEAGDGAGPGRWTLRWTGTGADSIAAGARFVIGGALVPGPPDVVITLALQNGPDAVRLVWPDGAIEVVGYGTLADSEYFCGEPAVDVPAGQSLARIPDDAEQGSNALDFAPAEPSPGRPNQVTRDAAIVRGSIALDPPQPEVRAAARLSAVLVNRGIAALGPGEVAIAAFVDGAPVAAGAAGALGAGDCARATLDLPPLAAGLHALVLRALLAGDERPANDADSMLARVGAGPLQITEIQFHPASGEGEWVEVRARGPEPVALSDFTLSDRGDHAAALPGDLPALEPDSLALLVQDRAALLGRYAALDPARVIEVSPWAALNNSDDAGGVADVVTLRGPGGTPCDRVPYSARGIPAGVPLELGVSGWGADSDPAGTPLAPPRGGPAANARFDLGPRRVRAGELPRLAWALPWPRAQLGLEIFDLSGRRVARLPDVLVGARGARRIDALPGPGLYLVAIVARSEDGAGVIRATRALRIEGRGP